MKHWVEPQVLGEAQRTGYSSGQAELQPHGVQHYVNRPGQLSGDLQHYVNRPGQLSGLGAIKDMRFGWVTLFLTATTAVLLSSQIKGMLKKIKKKV